MSRIASQDSDFEQNQLLQLSASLERDEGYSDISGVGFSQSE
jgi:hypothetical protein